MGKSPLRPSNEKDSGSARFSDCSSARLSSIYETFKIEGFGEQIIGGDGRTSVYSLNTLQTQMEEIDALIYDLTSPISIRNSFQG